MPQKTCPKCGHPMKQQPDKSYICQMCQYVQPAIRRKTLVGGGK